MITKLMDKIDIEKIISTKLTLDNKDIPEYFIAKSKDNKIVHYGELTEGLQMATGQPVVLSYKDRKLWVTELVKLGIDPDVEIEDIEIVIKEIDKIVERSL